MQSSMPTARVEEVWTAKSNLTVGITVVDAMRRTLPPHDHCMITRPPKNTALTQIAKAAAPKDVKI